jgi:hypothetical protein
VGGSDQRLRLGGVAIRQQISIDGFSQLQESTRVVVGIVKLSRWLEIFKLPSREFPSKLKAHVIISKAQRGFWGRTRHSLSVPLFANDPLHPVLQIVP